MKKILFIILIMNLAFCNAAPDDKISEIMIWLNATLPISQEYEGKLKDEFAIAKDVRKSITPILEDGVFRKIEVRNKDVIAYEVKTEEKTLLVALNTNSLKSAVADIPNIAKSENILPLKITNIPKIINHKIHLELQASEIVVLLITYSPLVQSE